MSQTKTRTSVDIGNPYLQDAMVGMLSEQRGNIKDFRINSDYGPGGYVSARIDFEVLITQEGLDVFQFPHKYRPTRVKENSDEDSD